MAVTFDSSKNEIHIEDLGVTLRTLLAVAAKGLQENGNRKWKIVYKFACIGNVQVKDFDERKQHARPAIRTPEGVKRQPSLAKALARANLALAEGSSGKVSKPHRSESA